MSWLSHECNNNCIHSKSDSEVGFKSSVVESDSKSMAESVAESDFEFVDESDSVVDSESVADSDSDLKTYAES